VEPYFQSHPCANEVQERVMQRPSIVVQILLPQHFPRLSSTILIFCRSGGALPPPSPYTNTGSWFPSSPYLTSDFSRLSTAILTFLKAVEPYLQRHPYTNIRFWFLSSPYLTQLFFTPLYHNFNFSWRGGAQPPTSPLYQHQILIPLLPSPIPTFFPTSLPPF